MQNVSSVPVIDGYTTYTKHVWQTDVLLHQGDITMSFSATSRTDGPVSNDEKMYIYKATSITDFPRYYTNSGWVFDKLSDSDKNLKYPNYYGSSITERRIFGWYNRFNDVNDTPSTDESTWWYCQTIYMNTYIAAGYRWATVGGYASGYTPYETLYYIKSASVDRSTRVLTMVFSHYYTIIDSYVDEPYEMVITKETDKYPDNSYVPTIGTDVASNTFYYKKVS